ncbi:hypothetical protein PGIGA_G00082340 [Pangasianodon gigas]|uniref:Uncharacterized protein n=1 Tax=Pangasianodon gigas TaxID=30993 RepID=A0ACC5XAS7_PANGG|nr:hypothetical protein [Pangasianodon gigas]
MKIQQFRKGVLKELENIFHCPLQLGPKACLLGIGQEFPFKFQGIHLLQILLYCARKCILVCWIIDQTPSITQYGTLFSFILGWKKHNYYSWESRI